MGRGAMTARRGGATMHAEIIETKTASISWVDGIVFQFARDNVEETVETAKENVAAIRSVGASRPRFVCVEMGKIRTVSRAARQVYAEAEAWDAVAMVVRTPIARVLGSFFLSISKPAWPMRIFSDRKAALEWLRSL